MRTAATAAPADEQLTAHAGARDQQQAFVSLYETHLDGVYDFALRVVRDSRAAARIVQATCEQARNLFVEQGYGRNLTAWLYVSARSCALDDLRDRRGARRPSQRDREGLVFTRVQADRLADPYAAFDKELVELVWDSAAVLSPEEYSLLDLHLRRELTAEELEKHLELNGSAATTLSRLRRAFEETVTATLVATRWRSCERLDLALSDLGDLPAADVRRVVIRHLRDCEQCQESQRHFFSPSQVFACLAPMSPTPALRKQLLKRLERPFVAPARWNLLRHLTCGS